MPIQQDFVSYHKSIGDALKNSEQRIRNLIGNSHWLTDGEHKESILRRVISDFAPEIYRIGSGFICYPSSTGNSSQIDILVTSKMKPTLYKSGVLQFVTPDCAEAVVEVKTKLTRGNSLNSVLQKLSDQIEMIRETNPDCWAGLFIYDAGNLTEEDILSSIQSSNSNLPQRAINCVALGENKLVRYWNRGHSKSGLPPKPIWHGYNILNLSQPYFISNLISFLSPGFDEETAEAWFPIAHSKEVHKTFYAISSESEVRRFQD